MNWYSVGMKQDLYLGAFKSGQRYIKLPFGPYRSTQLAAGGLVFTLGLFIVLCTTGFTLTGMAYATICAGGVMYLVRHVSLESGVIQFVGYYLYGMKLLERSMQSVSTKMSESRQGKKACQSKGVSTSGGNAQKKNQPQSIVDQLAK